MSEDISVQIQETVKAMLPSLTEEKSKLLIEKLILKGVENTEDLKYIKEDDMVEFINPVQCRKLLVYWKGNLFVLSS